MSDAYEKALEAAHARIQLRCPLIPQHNARSEHLDAIVALAGPGWTGWKASSCCPITTCGGPNWIALGSNRPCPSRSSRPTSPRSNPGAPTSGDTASACWAVEQCACKQPGRHSTDGSRARHRRLARRLRAY